jgi:peroxiredoxin
MLETLATTFEAPDFELSDTQGKQIRLSDFRGKVVMLVLLRGFI